MHHAGAAVHGALEILSGSANARSEGVTMKRLQRHLAIHLLVVCAATTAAAAGPAAGSDAGSEAATHFNRGVQLYREGNLDAALAEATT